jgi:hypothetical protein
MFTKLNMNKIKFNSITNGESFLNKIYITCPPKPNIKPSEPPSISNFPKLLLEPLESTLEESSNIAIGDATFGGSKSTKIEDRKIISINVKYSNSK